MASLEWMPPGIDVEKLRKEERELSARLRVVRRVLQAISGEAPSVTGTARVKKSRRANTRVRQIVTVLREAGKPLSVKQIYEKLRERDSSLRWRNPAPVFRSYLRRQSEGPDQVIRTSRGLYGFRRWAEGGLPSEVNEGEAISEARRETNLDIAERILRECGRPLTVAEIVKELQARGIQLRATRPIESMQANLTLSPRFVRVAPRTFDLAGRPNMEAKREET